jgi:hypothetical protein
LDTNLETTTRQRWLDVLSQFTVHAAPEYRREHARVDIGSAKAEVSFDGSERPDVRGGTVLSASPGGLMIRQQRPIDLYTPLRLNVLIRGQTFALAGRVQHCTPTAGGYKLGIKLEFAD